MCSTRACGPAGMRKRSRKRCRSDVRPAAASRSATRPIVDSREYGTPSSLIGIMERARTDGVDVMYDVYPYLAGGTTMDQLVPTWVQDGGVEAMLARLEDSETRRRAVADTN